METSSMRAWVGHEFTLSDDWQLVAPGVRIRRAPGGGRSTIEVTSISAGDWTEPVPITIGRHDWVVIEADVHARTTDSDGGVEVRFDANILRFADGSTDLPAA